MSLTSSSSSRPSGIPKPGLARSASGKPAKPNSAAGPGGGSGVSGGGIAARGVGVSRGNTGPPSESSPAKSTRFAMDEDSDGGGGDGGSGRATPGGAVDGSGAGSRSDSAAVGGDNDDDDDDGIAKSIDTYFASQDNVQRQVKRLTSECVRLVEKLAEEEARSTALQAQLRELTAKLAEASDDEPSPRRQQGRWHCRKGGGTIRKLQW